MSSAALDSGMRGPGPHPLVRRRKLEDRALWTLTCLGVLALALFLATIVQNPNVALVILGVVGLTVLIALIVEPRLELTVGFLAIFLGCLDGPIKGFGGGGNATAVLQDVLIAAVCIGALARLLSKHEPVRLPPMSGWVLTFVALVLVEAFNPNTLGLLKILGGFRQQLEWTPFFFFGYALIRSEGRLRTFFILLGVIASANGVVSALEMQASPKQIASLGPGYAEHVEGANGVSGTGFKAEGEAHVRPLALGSDIGFGGGLGVIALPATLVLMATGAFRRKWIAPLLCAGALVAVVTSLSRTSVLGAVIALLAFAGFSLSTGRQVIRPLLSLLALLVIAAVVVTLLSSTGGASAFDRYSSITPEKVGTTAPSYKEISIKQIPNDIANDPFGFGLGVSGAASGFGGHTTVKLEGHGFSSETEYNFLMNEVGLPGLVLWIGLTLTLIFMGLTRLTSVADLDVRLSLAALFAAISALTLMGFEGAFMASQGSGPFFWFATGTISYWMLGPGRLQGPAGAPRGPDAARASGDAQPPPAGILAGAG